MGEVVQKLGTFVVIDAEVSLIQLVPQADVKIGLRLKYECELDFAASS